MIPALLNHQRKVRFRRALILASAFALTLLGLGWWAGKLIEELLEQV